MSRRPPPSLPIGIDTTWYVARQVDHHPKVIGVIEPAYPEEAKRRNIEGSLKLMLKIDDLGDCDHGALVRYFERQAKIELKRPPAP